MLKNVGKYEQYVYPRDLTLAFVRPVHVEIDRLIANYNGMNVMVLAENNCEERKL